MTVRVHQVKVDWPGRIERFSDYEVEEYIKQALTWYNSHTGYKHFTTCEEPEVISVQIIEDKEQV